MEILLGPQEVKLEQGQIEGMDLIEGHERGALEVEEKKKREENLIGVGKRLEEEMRTEGLIRILKDEARMTELGDLKKGIEELMREIEMIEVGMIIGEGMEIGMAIEVTDVLMKEKKEIEEVQVLGSVETREETETTSVGGMTPRVVKDEVKIGMTEEKGAEWEVGGEEQLGMTGDRMIEVDQDNEMKQIGEGDLALTGGHPAALTEVIEEIGMTEDDLMIEKKVIGEEEGEVKKLISGAGAEIEEIVQEEVEEERQEGEEEIDGEEWKEIVELREKMMVGESQEGDVPDQEGI